MSLPWHNCFNLNDFLDFTFSLKFQLKIDGKLTVQNDDRSHGDPEENAGPIVWIDHCKSNGHNEDDHLNYNTPDDTRR